MCVELEAMLIPQLRTRGQNATLLCKYKLDKHEELFSLKWQVFTVIAPCQ